MARDVSRAQKAIVASRWHRFVRGVKRVVTAVSLITMAGLLGFATKLATDMPVGDCDYGRDAPCRST